MYAVTHTTDRIPFYINSTPFRRLGNTGSGIPQRQTRLWDAHSAFRTTTDPEEAGAGTVRSPGWRLQRPKNCPGKGLWSWESPSVCKMRQKMMRTSLCTLPSCPMRAASGKQSVRSLQPGQGPTLSPSAGSALGS